MKYHIITKTILLVSLVSLFNDIANEMLYPVMPVYLRSIGFSVMLIGILEGLAEATAGLSKGYFGNLSDKTGKRVPFIQAGYSLSAISKPLMAVLTFPVWIFFIRTLDRLGKGVRTSARDALLSAESAPENKGKVFGFHQFMDTAGAALGPLLALLFLYYLPGRYKWLFILALIPGLITVFITILLKDKKVKPDIRKEKIAFFSYFKYWKAASPGYRKLTGGLLAFTLFNSSDALLLLLMKHQGLSDYSMIGMYIFYNLVYAAFSYPAGALADKAGLKKVLIAGMIFFAIVYSCIGFVHSIMAFGVLFFIYGIYAASTEGISKALITNLSKSSETATAIGFYSACSSILALLASSMGGILWFCFSPRVCFITSAIGVFLVIIWFIIIFSRKRVDVI
ncbi:MAG: MFS transporter [Bacteroidia bacterium]|nr:MFS transporter [Bacteroidia bacterium]